ncbi:MAG: adenylate kinase [Fimbriimonadales bacterium]
MRLILLGAPGVGKGTQARAIADRYRIPHIATGDILRLAADSCSDVGLQAKEYMVRGDLVPDALIIGCVRERLDKADAATGFLLDGFPRTVPQAEALDSLLLEIGQELDAVIAIDVEEETIVRRLDGRRTCGDCGAVTSDAANSSGRCERCSGTLLVREDDKPEAIRQRLAVYKEKRAPLFDYYSDRGLLRKVDGNGGVEEIERRIEAVL